MKIRTILLSLCCLSVLSTFAQNKKFNQPLADSLAKWVKVDQIAASVPQGEYKNWTRERWDNFNVGTTLKTAFLIPTSACLQIFLSNTVTRAMTL